MIKSDPAKVRLPIKFLLLLVCLGTLIYANVLQSPFQFDDHSYVVKNPYIRSLSAVQHVWPNALERTRIIVFFTFALNYMFHQFDVFGYHLINLLIHLGCTFFVWHLSQLLCFAPQFHVAHIKERRFLFANITALIFLTHPIQTQAVTYISQRFTSLATLFYLMTVVCYLKARLLPQKTFQTYRWYLLTICLLITSMFTKEITFTLPFAIILIELLFFKDGWKSSQIYLKRILIPTVLVCLIIPALVQFNVFKIFIAQRPSASHGGEVITAYNYFLTQFRVIVRYIQLLFVPIGQNLDYDFVLSTVFLDKATLLAFFALGIVFLFAIIMFERNRIVSFGIFWFFLTLAVESSIIPITHVIFEHRLYLPCVGFALFLGASLTNAFFSVKRLKNAAVLVVVTLSILTIQRNMVWRTEFSLWQDVVQKSPNKARGYYNLGIFYFKKNKTGLAEKHFQEALRINPSYVEVYRTLGIIYTQNRNYQKALQNFDQALKRYEDIDSYYGRAQLYLATNQIHLALLDSEKVVALDPTNSRGYNIRGLIYKKAGKSKLALENFSTAIKVAPDSAHSYNNRANLYRELKQVDLAIEDYERVLTLNKGFVVAYNNLGIAYEQKLDFSRALENYSEAIKLNPQYIDPYFNRATLYLKQTKPEAAIKEYSRVLDMNPGYLKAYYNRAAAYMKVQKFKEAYDDYTRVINHDPKNGGAYYNRSVVLKIQHQFAQALVDAMRARDLGERIDPQYLEGLQELLNDNPS